jgi:hypothetical protein
MPRRTALALAVIALSLAPPARACLLCSGGGNSQTLRQQAATAKLILYGTLANPRLAAAAPGGGAGGTTDLVIEGVLKSDPFLGGRKVVTINRYVPVDPKAPPKFLLFCDVFNGQLDAYAGVPVRSPALVEYLKGALAIDPKDRVKSLQQAFGYLDSPDVDVAADAYLEFARASDTEVDQVAPKLAADKLRKLVTDPQTPPERLGLYAFLLGAAGGDREAELLNGLLQHPTERTRPGYSGILAGYVRLRPSAGWNHVLSILGDPQRPFTERFAALNTLRFCQRARPEQSRPEVHRGLTALLPQGDIADIAIEDLRRAKDWDLTADVLAQWGKKSHDTPMMKRAILRYALSCPRPEAAAFVAERRRSDPDLVQDVVEALEFEKPVAAPAGGTGR